jgi:glycopeptide antibiotics resistance protein
MLFIIGSSFYKLAQTYNKNKVLYVLMGLGITFGVQFLVGILWGVYQLKKGGDGASDDLMINIIAGIVSAFVVYFFYLHLKKKNENNPDNIVNQIEQLGETTIEDESTN